jgi:hypothetical protein
MTILSLDWGPGENGKIEKRAPLSRRLLNIDVKKWSLDRGLQDISIHRRWHSAFHLEMGALRPPVVNFVERAGSRWGQGLSPRLSPFWAFPAEVPQYTMVGGTSGCRSLLGGALPEGCDEVMVSFILFSLFSGIPVIVYRHG